MPFLQAWDQGADGQWSPGVGSSARLALEVLTWTGADESWTRHKHQHRTARDFLLAQTTWPGLWEPWGIHPVPSALMLCLQGTFPAPAHVPGPAVLWAAVTGH